MGENEDIDIIDEVDSDEDSSSEGDFYTPKSEFPKPKLVYDQLVRIADKRSREMKPGHTDYVIDKNGNEKHVEIPDFRREYISSVKFLIQILKPEGKKDKEYSKYKEEFDKKEKEILKKWDYHEIALKEFIDKQNPRGIIKWVETGRTYMPEIDEKLPNPHTSKPNNILQEKGLWNNYFNAYYYELVDLYDEIVGEINCLVERLGYYKPGLNF